MLKGHLPRVIYHRVYQYTNIVEGFYWGLTGFSQVLRPLDARDFALASASSLCCLYSRFIYSVFSVYSQFSMVYWGVLLRFDGFLSHRCCGCWTRARLCALASASGLFTVYSRFIQCLFKIYPGFIELKTPATPRFTNGI